MTRQQIFSGGGFFLPLLEIVDFRVNFSAETEANSAVLSEKMDLRLTTVICSHAE